MEPTDPVQNFVNEPVAQQQPAVKQHVFVDGSGGQKSCDPDPTPAKHVEIPGGHVPVDATQQESQDTAQQKGLQQSSDPPEKTRDPIQQAPKPSESGVSVPLEKKSPE